MPKFGIKNVWAGYFWAVNWKQYCHIWNQHPQISLIAKFREKTKKRKSGTKNALFGYFWPKILYMGIFGPQINKWAIVIFEINALAKFHEKTKMLKFGTKNAWFGYFRARISKKLLPCLKSVHLNLSKMSL